MRVKLIVTSFLLLLFTTVVGNSTNDDFTVGNGLNIGILFLMAIPYVILFFLFRKKLFNIYKSFKTNS